MAISKIKFVTIVAAREGAASNIDIELNINGGGNWEGVAGQAQGVVTETLITLDEPIALQDFKLDLFDLYVGSLSSSATKLLLESIYVVDDSPGSANQLLLGIPKWPQNLWLQSEPQSISGGYAVAGCNLGVVATMAN
jgi:hypothetical protein